MTGEYEVVVFRSMRPSIEGYAVGIRHVSTRLAPEIIADDLPIQTAISQLGRRVQRMLDQGRSIADIRRDLDLENAAVPA